MGRPIPDRYHVFDMPSDELAFLLHRPEVANQPLQQRCFVASSFRNKTVVAELVARLRLEGWFVYDFTAAELSLDERDWGGLSYAEAQAHAEIMSAAQSDLLMLRGLGAPDVLLVVLPGGLLGRLGSRLCERSRRSRGGVRRPPPTGCADPARRARCGLHRRRVGVHSQPRSSGLLTRARLPQPQRLMLHPNGHHSAFNRGGQQHTPEQCRRSVVQHHRAIKLGLERCGFRPELPPVNRRQHPASATRTLSECPALLRAGALRLDRVRGRR